MDVRLYGGLPVSQTLVWMDQTWDVAEYLEGREDRILEDAKEAVGRARLLHYDFAGAPSTDDRLRTLFHVLVDSCRDRHLDAALSYADSIARERQSAHFALSEVQTAINVLEEAVWRSLIFEAPPGAQAGALGVVSTVLGAVKDRVACSYLAHVAPDGTFVRVESLFAGTEALAVDS